MFELGDPPPGVVVMSEEDLTADMADFIRAAPRTWKEILQQYNGQPSQGGLRGVQQPAAPTGTLR
ncbi:hypothetical protein O6P37_12895 [Mycobacterium sp. CPCC 205372]|uniref:Uncharacterized protein n=1 Tax=Mycobacterium hippophais TaxID=3016340 RepID=A0ABT4PTE4_9MYCO|nr:hypothetical protein [Mycobacterium hippophais]MCZ8379764.1 hypothetical protein [Mycobacterium hippophais]